MISGFLTHIAPYIEDLPAFREALSGRKKRAFRITVSRNIPYEDELKGRFNYSPVPGVDHTYFIEDGYEKAAETLSFQTGGIYLQNPSSVLPAQILAAYLPDNPLVLDMAAAPGGKTCALSDLIARRGMIVANEPSKSRLKALHFNLEKGGAWNVKTISADGTLLSRWYKETFDGVLLDAPCSHENQIGVNKKVLDQWTPDYVEKMAHLQKQLILSAFDCLKPGGVLVYSTCTFSVGENEHVVAYLLEQRRETMLEKPEHPYSRGISGIDAIDECVLRVFPHLSEMDGFFVAVIRKEGELAPNQPALRKMVKSHAAFLETYFELPDWHTRFFLNEAGGRLFLEAPYPLCGDFRRTGMVLAKPGKQGFEPMSQAIWELGRTVFQHCKVPVSYETALDYMKGFDTGLSNQYDGTIFYYGEIPVGVVKIVGASYKNKLDRYFLYGKNIEF